MVSGWKKVVESESLFNTTPSYNHLIILREGVAWELEKLPPHLHCVCVMIPCLCSFLSFVPLSCMHSLWLYLLHVCGLCGHTCRVLSWEVATQRALLRHVDIKSFLRKTRLAAYLLLCHHELRVTTVNRLIINMGTFHSYSQKLLLFWKQSLPTLLEMQWYEAAHELHPDWAVIRYVCHVISGCMNRVVIGVCLIFSSCLIPGALPKTIHGHPDTVAPPWETSALICGCEVWAWFGWKTL